MDFFSFPCEISLCGQAAIFTSALDSVCLSVFYVCLSAFRAFSPLLLLSPLVFCKYQLYGQALPCLVKAVNWRQAVVVARKLSYTHEAMLELAESLAGKIMKVAVGRKILSRVTLL